MYLRISFNRYFNIGLLNVIIPTDKNRLFHKKYSIQSFYVVSVKIVLNAFYF